MDGMNPTLAFAVLLFGLSGNTRDDTVDPTMEADRGSGCPLLMIVANPPAPASQTDLAAAFELGDGEANISPLPDVAEPAWVNAGPAPLNDGADPMMRRMALAGMNAAEPDPCAAER
jgi:hypothetical protein